MSPFHAPSKVLIAVRRQKKGNVWSPPLTGSSQLATSKQHGEQLVAVISNKSVTRGVSTGPTELCAVIQSPREAEEGETGIV